MLVWDFGGCLKQIQKLYDAKVYIMVHFCICTNPAVICEMTQL